MISPQVAFSKGFMEAYSRLPKKAQKKVRDHERIGSADSGEHRGFFYYRENFERHFLDDLIGVTVGHEPGGRAAMELRIAEQYVEQFGEIAKESTTLVVPANLTDIASMIAVASR